MERGRKIFWGVLLLLGAVVLLVERLGYLELGGIGFWNILLSVLLAGWFVDGVLRLEYGSMLFAAACFVIVNDELLGLEAITPFPVLAAALLGTLGLNMVLPAKYKYRRPWKKHATEGGAGAHVREGDGIFGEEIHYEVSFSESVKYVAGQSFSHAHLESSFGSLTVYFEETLPKEGAADVKVDVSFGSMVLCVPHTWKVSLRVDTPFGGVKEMGHCNPDGENALEIYGTVSFGSLEIHYL